MRQIVQAITGISRVAAVAALLFLALTQPATDSWGGPYTQPRLTAEQAQERTAAAFDAMADRLVAQRAAPEPAEATAFDAMVAEQVATLTHGRACWPTVYDIPNGERPSIMLVRNARQGIGPDQGSVGVVRVVTFDEGWQGVEEGVFVWVASCR